MELKLKFNEKERHILYRVLAVVLCICIFAMAVLSLTYIGMEYKLTGRPYLATAFIISFISIPIGVAVFKHYR